jgi:pimeloyl-ACP methyl ester carboxylesterase
LLIRGRLDQVVPDGCIDAYLEAIAGAQLAEIDGAGHRPEIENATAFDRGVRKFLA